MATGTTRAGLRVDVLGPLRVGAGDAEVDVRGPKRRAVLALLAVVDGRAVTDDALLDALWPDEIPDSGRAALHSHVSRLRAQLGAAGENLERLDGAYRLRLAADGLDLSRAAAALADARRRLATDPAAADDLARGALALWRGPVLAEFGDVPPLAAQSLACADLRRDLSDLSITAALAANRLEGLVSEAVAALALDPLREPAVLLLMQAQARTGQAAAALDAARTFRARLADETGLDPSPALAALERSIAAGALAPTGDVISNDSARSGGDVISSGGRTRVRAGDFATPPAVHRLVGRDDQVAELVELLRTERLVTLIGPGGVGKTRLAQAVADRVEAAGFVVLAPVTEAAGIPAALATALDVRGHHPDLLAACVAVLAARPAVLVVDNCEHLIEPVRDGLAALLAGCPDLHLLATSRSPIGLSAEVRHRVGPLADDAGVDVFCDRAARVRPGFAPTAAERPVVADIVRRLDGMPLAIELAAGRLASFSLADLHERLDRALDLLGDGRPSADARHRTLRDTVQWSYTLLPEGEQRLFRHLAAFADGVDLATAERLAADLDVPGDPATALAHLVDASMLEVDLTTGRTRYRMLETLRAFGADRLAAAGESATAAARVVSWSVDLAAHIDERGHSAAEPEADATLRREVLNLRAAFALAREHGRLDAAAAIVTSLADARSWRDLTRLTGWAEELLAAGFPDDHPGAVAVHAGAAMDAYMRGDHVAAERFGRGGLELVERGGGTGDARRFLLVALSSAALTRADWDAAVAYDLDAEKYATRPSSSPAVGALGALYGGDLDLARELTRRTLERANYPALRAFALYVEGEISSTAGDLAEERYAEAIALARAAGATFVVGIASVGRLAALTERGGSPRRSPASGTSSSTGRARATGRTSGSRCGISPTSSTSSATRSRRRSCAPPPTATPTPRRCRPRPGRSRPGPTSPAPVPSPPPAPPWPATSPERSRPGEGGSGRVDERLVADPAGVEVGAHARLDAGGLAGLGAERGDLAGEQAVVENEVEGEGVVRHHDRAPGFERGELVVEVAELGPPARGDGGVEQARTRGGGAAERGRRPGRDRDVVGVPGLAVGAEREDGVRPDRGDQRRDPGDLRLRVEVGAAAVGQVQPVVLDDAEDGERGRHLRGADGREALRRLLHRVAPGLAAGGGHADDAGAGVAGGRVDPAAQVRLVVGVGPDAEDRAEVRDRGRQIDHAACSSHRSHGGSVTRTAYTALTAPLTASLTATESGTNRALAAPAHPPRR
nr:BTAD domain-containing putative transcriptional regulator [Sporichthya polymorpha]